MGRIRSLVESRRLDCFFFFLVFFFSFYFLNGRGEARWGPDAANFRLLYISTQKGGGL